LVGTHGGFLEAALACQWSVSCRGGGGSREAAKPRREAQGVRVVNGGIPAAHPGTAVTGSPGGDFVARAFQPEHIA